jgi:TRAP-type C4-dicarboxylate transport system permease small subunit
LYQWYVTFLNLSGFSETFCDLLMRRKILKLLLAVLALLSLFFALLWFWAWYQAQQMFDTPGLSVDQAPGQIIDQQSALGRGLAAAVFILLSLVLVVALYRLIRSRAGPQEAKDDFHFPADG